MHTPLYYVLVYSYLFVLLVVCTYGLHRYYLVYLYYKHRKNVPQAPLRFEQCPRVTVQLPMYNERLVAERVIEHACRIDYPPDRLQIQVLDDSTDESRQAVQQTVARLQTQGHSIELLQRSDRHGYKAGALEAGLQTASGEFVCIFDADFVPPPNILTDAIDYFTDPAVGMVQVRWEHINRNQSLLTKAQAILLDGHFVVEHGARNRAGRFMNFNGTAGIWRKSCIQDAGGWQHDTLTEDLDLSYRAQLRGWKFLFIPTITAPAEIPPQMGAFKAQQHRWTKGGAQTCKKLLPTILRSTLPWGVKIEAFFHLTSNVVYAFVVALTFFLFPTLYLNLKAHLFNPDSASRFMFDFSLLALATFSASTFYICSQRESNKGWWHSIKYLPALMSLGVGIAVNNARAMFQGFFGKPSEFVRTPKFGIEDDQGTRDKTQRMYTPKSSYKLQPWFELAIGLYLVVCLVACFRVHPLSLGIPFLFLFAAGYLYVALTTLLEPWLQRRMSWSTARPSVSAP